MKRAHHANHDLHPKSFINAQILWIIVGTGILYKGLPLIASSWKAGETYNLPLGIAYTAIGIVVVISRFLVVNDAVRQLQSKTPSNPDPSEASRAPLSPPTAL